MATGYAGSGEPMEVSFSSYDDAQQAMEILDEETVPVLAEYNRVHNMNPTRLELEFPAESRPIYHLYFEPGGKISEQMVEDGMLEEELTDKTSYNAVRQVKPD